VLEDGTITITQAVANELFGLIPTRRFRLAAIVSVSTTRYDGQPRGRVSAVDVSQ
jgi:hypothetical protein